MILQQTNPSCLHYRGNKLYIEDIKLEDIAKQYGTPCYIYSANKIINNWQSFDKAFKSIQHTICFAVKANSNLAILHMLATLGSGFDIVSVGELERVIKAGGSPKKIVFSGVGKQHHEIKKALEYGVHCIDVESLAEIDRVNAIAEALNITADIALRVNPNVDANTHSHITTGLNENKFGIDCNQVIAACEHIIQLKHLNLIGIAAHIGSQITEIRPFLESVEQLIDLYLKIQSIGIQMKHINIGGGLGITYQQEQPPMVAEYADKIIEKIKSYPVNLIIEPGRAIVGNAGILLTHIEYIKKTAQRHFAIVDAGMNDLIRPALYDAWQAILPVIQRTSPMQTYDIAGPVCESADIFGKERKLAIIPGDLLAIDCAGAYGFSMSSNYNSRCRAPEVLVSGTEVQMIRRRETIDDLFAHEEIPVIV